MPDFATKEIELSKCLHEALRAKGQLPEIREGDWFFIQNPAEPSKPIFHICKDIEDAKEINGYRNDIILLWSWSRCREWLRERGWTLESHDDFIGVRLVFYNRENHLSALGSDKNIIYRRKGQGQTDLEAILAVMVKIAEEDRP